MRKFDIKPEQSATYRNKMSVNVKIMFSKSYCNAIITWG